MSDNGMRIIGFCCRNTLDFESDVRDRGRLNLEPKIKIVTIPCSSKIDTLAIIKGFESGADGVFVLGCAQDHCRLMGGNTRARKVVNYTRHLLDEIGIDQDRLVMFQLEADGVESFNQVTESISKTIEKLGKA